MGTISPFIRIGLYILGSFLIGRGMASEEDMWIFTDPELIGAISLALSGAWYALAKKFGWAT